MHTNEKFIITLIVQDAVEKLDAVLKVVLIARKRKTIYTNRISQVALYHDFRVSTISTIMQFVIVSTFIITTFPLNSF